MASKKDNVKALFSNTRTRVIILFTLVLLIFAVVVGYFKLRQVNPGPATSASVGKAPTGIRSIPGVLDPTAQYAKLQEEQNVTQATQAQQSGTSAIPTIIRTQAIGKGVGVIGAQGGQSGVGFTALARADDSGLQRSLWIQDLKEGSCKKSIIDKVVTQGAQLSDLKGACSCVQLKYQGYGLKELEQVCECKELRAAGYNARQLKEVGYSADRLRSCGFDACELRNAGFTAQEMKDGGYSDGELKGAGFTNQEIIKASGLPDGITVADVRQAGCNADALAKLRKAGVSASAIRKISGCSAAQLRAAGFSAKELKDAGYSAADLKKAGFGPAELKAAGYSARDLLNAGYNNQDLANAGYTPEEIKIAGTELPPGITPNDVKNAGCDIEVLRQQKNAGVSAVLIKQYAGCGSRALGAAGFGPEDLANAGFSEQEISAAVAASDKEIKAAGCDPDQLRDLYETGVSSKRIKELNGCAIGVLRAAGFNAAELKTAGFSPADLKAAGFSARELLSAGISPDDLAKIGFSAQEIQAAGTGLPLGITPEAVKNAGCDPQALKRQKIAGVSAALIKKYASCSAENLKAAGFSDDELVNAGFTPAIIQTGGTTTRGASLSDNDIKAAGCDPDNLKKLFAAGVSAKRIRDLNGCSTQALKNAGYGVRSLMDAGFNPSELLAAGYTQQQLKDAELSPAAIIASGRLTDCTPETLKQAKAAGISALTIKQTMGCSAQALKAAGYSAKELRDAGFTAAELRDAGFGIQDLKAAGYSAKELRDSGFSADELKAAGFSAKDLKDAGYTAAELKKAGFRPDQLKTAGFSAKELKDAGFSAAELKNAGMSAKELKDAGFSMMDMKNAGVTAKELKDIGVSAAELKNAGYSAKDMKDAFFTAADLKNAGYTTDQLLAGGYSQAESRLAGLQDPNLQQYSSNVAGIPSLGGTQQNLAQVESSNDQLQAILSKQNQQIAEQKYQQKIQQRTSDMLASANQALQSWKSVSGQVYIAGQAADEKQQLAAVGAIPQVAVNNNIGVNVENKAPVQETIIKTGDILFAVMDTSVNSDEPGPILATIVSGRLKGAKLIGSFNLPANANKMVISFNTMSVPGATRTMSISAFAIDPNTARTALSSRTDHHYLMRYGSLFASSFIEGFGNAFQSANTTVTIGGTGGGNDITVANGVGRSTLENAVIGLATVGKAWGQQAQQLFNTPTTVEVFSGTGLGILFTQDVKIT